MEDLGSPNTPLTPYTIGLLCVYKWWVAQLIDSCTMLKLRSNSSSQNQLLRWGVSLFIDSYQDSYLSDLGVEFFLV